MCAYAVMFQTILSVAVPVVIGDSDDVLVVVQEGLSEGDAVVVETTGSAASQFGIGFGGAQGQAFRQIIGGGFRRGGTGNVTAGGGGGGGGAQR